MENPHLVDLYARKDLDRFVAFSDGVFAVAITLLALNFKMPEVGKFTRLSGSYFGVDISNHSPFFVGLFLSDSGIFTGYVLSFLVVGMYWIAHHRVIRYIVRIDSTVLWLNILLLLFLGLVPFTTMLFNTYANVPLASAIYAGNQAMIGCMQFSIWFHASRRGRLIDSTLSSNTIKVLRIRTAMAPTIFLVSIPLAYIRIWLPALVWTVLFTCRLLILNLFPAYRASKRNAEMVRW